MSDKKADVYVPIVIGDYMADTVRFTTEEHGVYFLLIMDYWRSGPPPDDMDTLIRITKLTGKGKVATLRRVLSKFTLVGGKWHHKRCDKDIEEANRRKIIARENGKKGGNPALKKGQPNPYYDNPKDNLEDNPKDKAIDKRKISSSSSSSSSSTNTGGIGSTGDPKMPPNLGNELLKISDSEKQKLTDEFGKETVDYYIPFVSKHIEAKGETVTSFSAYLWTWITKDRTEKRGKFSNGSAEKKSEVAGLPAYKVYKAADADKADPVLKELPKEVKQKLESLYGPTTKGEIDG